MHIEMVTKERHLQKSVAVLRALADPSRLLIVSALLERPHCAEELAERLRRAPSTLSFHLRKLEEAGVVQKQRTQYYLVYRVCEELLQVRLRELATLPAHETCDPKQAKKYRGKVLSTFFRRGVLVQMPRQWRKRTIILEQFLAKFEFGRDYDEPEVNERIGAMFADYCTVRRMLVDQGHMTREGGRYRRTAPEGEEMQTRAELKRAYKEAPRQAGIFLITNTANGRVLLGSSLNLHGPLNKHRFLLNFGKHWVKPLQEDWNLQGAASFRFEIVQVVERKDDPALDVEQELAGLERAWLAKTRAVQTGYNKDDKIRE
jgi:DNA-binding HxlR family transcriptional regulator